MEEGVKGMDTKSLKSKRGSAIVGAIIVAILGGMISAAVLSSSFTEFKMSHRYMNAQNALNLAESGLEETVRAISSASWSGWTIYSGGYYKSEAVDWMDGGSTGTIKMYTDNHSRYPTVVAEGTVTDANGSSISRQIFVNMKESTRYANAMTSDTSIKFSGNGIVIDSYDSTNGNPSLTWGTNRFSNATAASNSVSVDDVDIQNGDVYGYLSIGASSYNISDLVGKNGKITDHDPSAPDKDASDRITTDFSMNLDMVPSPAYTTFNDQGAISSTTTLTNGRYQADSIDLGKWDELTINGDVALYVKAGVTIRGQITVANGASLKLYVVGDMDVGGNGVVNPNVDPSTLMIYGMNPVDGGQTFKISGNGTLTGVVDAPNANIEIKGGGSTNFGMRGSIVGYSIVVTGHQSFSWDENLKNLASGGGKEITFWRELRTQSEKMPFDNPSSLGTALSAALTNVNLY